MLKIVGTETAQDGGDGRSLLDEITREGGVQQFTRLHTDAIGRKSTVWQKVQWLRPDALDDVRGDSSQGATLQAKGTTPG